MDNMIKDIRPRSTFESYKIHTPSQKNALDNVKEMAADILSFADQFAPNTSPFSDGYMWILSRGPGVGKTHLTEAFINFLKENNPALVDYIYLLRRDLPTHSLLGKFQDHSFEKKPIIIIDDAFANCGSLNDLIDRDIRAFMGLVTYIYEKRALCLMTTNFHFISGILPLIKPYDPVGRIYSRCNELIKARAGELAIDGPDYRVILAQQAASKEQSSTAPEIDSRPDGKPPTHIIPGKTCH